jgi:hypothetical protein
MRDLYQEPSGVSLRDNSISTVRGVETVPACELVHP